MGDIQRRVSFRRRYQGKIFEIYIYVIQRDFLLLISAFVSLTMHRRPESLIRSGIVCILLQPKQWKLDALTKETTVGSLFSQEVKTHSSEDNEDSSNENGIDENNDEENVC